MFTTLHSSQNLATAFVTSLLAVMALVVVPTAAHATRIPSDPLAFATTPIALARMVYDAHAANVRAGLDELRLDVLGAD